MWNEFVSYIDKNKGRDQRICLVAWNGESCDMKRIYMLTRAPGSTLTMPKGVKYFTDPLHVIHEYKSCKLHPNTSKLERLSLPSLWEYIKKKRLEGPQNNLVDTTAQTDIVVHL